MSKVCINCGNQTEEESKYCHVCGAKISDVVEDSKAQSVNPVLVEEILDDVKVKKGIKRFFIMRNIIIFSVGVVLLASGLVGSHILREQKIEAVFNTSKEVFNHKDYDKAKVQFNEFLVDYPKAKQADEVKSLLKATPVSYTH